MLVCSYEYCEIFTCGRGALFNSKLQDISGIDDCSLKGNNAEVIINPVFMIAGHMVKNYMTVINILMESCLKNMKQ